MHRAGRGIDSPPGPDEARRRRAEVEARAGRSGRNGQSQGIWCRGSWTGYPLGEGPALPNVR